MPMPTSQKPGKPGKQPSQGQTGQSAPRPHLPSIEVFASGRHEDSSVPDVYFSPEFVQGLADEYNSQYPRRRAPATRGHPKPGDPAYGWVTRFSTIDDPTQLDEAGKPVRKLIADFADWDESFFDAIQRGRYRERSLGLKNGKAHHVAWLGAELPAVKGLAPVEFSEDGPDDEFETINFQAKAGGDDMTAEEVKAAVTAGLEPIVKRISKLEKAVAGSKPSDDDKPGKGDKKFSEAGDDGQAGDAPDGTQQGTQTNGASDARFSALDQQVKALAAQNATLNGQLMDAQFSSWLDQDHIRQRVTPAERQGVLGMMKHLASQAGVIQFSEDESLSPLQAYQKTIWDRQPTVITGEFSQATKVAMYGGGLSTEFAGTGAGSPSEADFLKLAEAGAALVNPTPPANYQGQK